MSDDRPADPTTLSDAGDPDEGDPRVFAAVQEYLRELEAGRHPSRREFLARHRDIAGELGACLDGLAFVHSAANQIAAEGAPAGPKLPEIDPETAQPLGDYRLIRQIGRGGMGVVYEALQLSLGRRVALKVLPMAAALDSRHLERFRNEASAAAQLHYTNIVPVYAVGCERSVHYYAMQLIEGQGLDEVIRELRDLGGAREPAALKGVDSKTVVLRGGSASAALSFTAPPTDAASPPAFSYSLSTLRTNRNAAYARSVANLGLQVAEALDYAHRVGVVHRDIKPANLLLDVKGTLWITDFGLAQFYADTNLTRSGDLIGTLRYMSPEQASGRAVVLDQRTDVYSLGVTLYELLTLERSFGGTTHEELLTQIARDEPRPPRSIDKTVPHELELILAKAYAKDAAERYQSAGAMADDLRRFLRDEPIRARAPSLWDKGVKWMRRHKAVAVSAVVILALAAIGFCISTLLIAHEQRQTRDALWQEKQQAIAAENRGRDARAAVQFFANIAAREMDKPEFSEVRREMLEEALGYYQKFLQDPGNNPAVSGELAAARRTYETFLDEYTSLDAFSRALQRISLLASRDVQRELGLTAEKALAIQGSLRDVIDPPGQGPAQDKTMSPEDRRRKYAGRVAKVEADMDAQLGEQGARRLKEIQRQHRGLATFGDPDVVDALRLSRDQKSEIARLQGEARSMRMDHGRDGGGGGGPGRHRGTTLEDRQAALKPAVDLLTPNQLQQWDKLVGQPFEGYAETFMGPGGGFGDHGFGGGPGHGLGHGDDFPGGPHAHEGDGFGPADRGDGPPPHD